MGETDEPNDHDTLGKGSLKRVCRVQLRRGGGKQDPKEDKSLLTKVT